MDTKLIVLIMLLCFING